MAKAAALTPLEIKHTFKVTQMMTHGEAKRCALALSFCALRCSEIARLDVQTVIYPSGKIRDEIHLPSEICKGLRPRTIWLTNKKFKRYVQEWIDYRLKKRWGTVIDGEEYQGLNPKSKLLYNNRGSSYGLSLKQRVNFEGETIDYWSSDALIDVFRKVYQKAGLKKASSHSGRKSIVSTGIIKGHSLEQMALLLGHLDPLMTLDYVDFDDNYLKRIYEIID